MSENLFKFGIWVIYLGLFIFASNSILAWLKGSYRMLLIEFPRRYRGKQMVKRASKTGHLVVFNSEKGLTAICSREDFQNAINIEKEEIDLEKDDQKKIHLALSPMLVMPFRIFTFANADESNQYVTGTEQDMRIMLAHLIHLATGYSRGQVNPESFKIAQYILTKKDRRLLVPFIREGHLPNGSLMPSLDSQVSFHGGKSIDDARRYILGLV